MQIKDIIALLSDKRPEMRLFGVHVLVKSNCEGREALLMKATADPSEMVWRKALNGLAYLHPWMLLKPFPIRKGKISENDDPWGSSWIKSWNVVHSSISEALVNNDSLSGDVLTRWAALPGIIPALVEEIERHNRFTEASSVNFAANIKEEYPVADRQLLVAPTYRCNISCTYCYVKGWNKWYGNQEMSREDLHKMISWCKNNDINYLMLGGGEPTIYSHLKFLLLEARRRNIAVRITSNTLYPKEVKRLIVPEYVRFFVSHYDQDHIQKKSPMADRYYQNLRAACSEGVETILRYTLTENSSREEWTHVLNIAEEYNIDTLNYAFAFKGILGENCYVKYPFGEPGGPFEEKFLNFISDCRKRGLSLTLGKPIPLCVFSLQTLRQLLFEGIINQPCTAYQRGFSKNLTINPDLSTLPCNAIGEVGPYITEFRNVQSAGSYFEPFLNNLFSYPYIVNCTRCMFYYRGFCAGVCLAEKYYRVKKRADR